ncbi:MAG TPA: glycosyl hydrolase, partial [Chloroflexota bacterium]|nr:glycosyl hydrolase [Chloroflexota bacterium]
ALAGESRPPLSAAQRLHRIDVRWYYDYSPRLEDEVPGYHKVAMVRGGEHNRTAPEEAAAQARRKPGRAWLIFNEPDLQEQDGVSDSFLAARGETRFQYYARLVHAYASAIKGADPTALLVGPNLFNLRGEGLNWLRQLEQAYRSEFNRELPFDVIGLHLYAFDPTWQQLPQMDLAANRRFLQDMLEYAAIRPRSNGQRTPVWVTEFGSMWIYHELQCREATPEERARHAQGQPATNSGDLASQQIRCRGERAAWPDVTAYVVEMVEMMMQAGVARWFLFSANPAPDPWAEVPNATYLMDAENRLTPLGEAWVKLRAAPPAQR